MTYNLTPIQKTEAKILACLLNDYGTQQPSPWMFCDGILTQQDFSYPMNQWYFAAISDMHAEKLASTTPLDVVEYKLRKGEQPTKQLMMYGINLVAALDRLEDLVWGNNIDLRQLVTELINYNYGARNLTI